MEDFLPYITEEVLILIPVLLILGKLLKSVELIYNWIIPWILLVIAIVFTFGAIGISWPNLFQAILATGTAVFTHQLIKQTVEKRN